MKKSIIISIAIFIAATAQAQPFQKGTTAANLGIGLGTALGGARQGPSCPKRII